MEFFRISGSRFASLEVDLRLSLRIRTVVLVDHVAYYGLRISERYLNPRLSQGY